MIVHNYQVFFIIFMVIVGAERMWETFLTKRSFEKGIVFKRWTLWALTFVYVLIMLLTLLEFLFIHESIHYSISFLGLFLFISALLGRNWSIKTLGKFHSNNIEIKNDHKLVKEGPYRFLRHPYYLSMMLEVTGITLIANSFYAFYLAIFGYVPLALLRAYYEERSMVKQFGEIYLNYKSEVNAFLPLKGIKEKS